jgi:hypothetical protein
MRNCSADIVVGRNSWYLNAKANLLITIIGLLRCSRLAKMQSLNHQVDSSTRECGLVLPKPGRRIYLNEVELEI